jgi:hypothetical protein
MQTVKLPFQFLIAFLAAASLAATEGQAATKALIVGIDRYANLPEQAQLRGCVNDAKAYQALIEEKFHLSQGDVRVLLDSEATGQAIKTSLREMATGTASGETRLFVFCGHGTQVPDLDGDEVDDHKDEALVPADAKADPASFVLDDDLHAILSSDGNGLWTVIVDACHSGTATKNLALDEGPRVRFAPYSLFLAGKEEGTKALGDEEFRDPSRGPLTLLDLGTAAAAGTRAVSPMPVDRVCLLAACRPNQKAQEDQGHGKFSKFFLDSFQNGTFVPGVTTYDDIAKKTNVQWELKLGSQTLEQNPIVDVPSGLRGAPFLGSPAKNLVLSDPSSSDSFQVDVSIKGGPVLCEGDAIEVTVTSERAGYLTLLGWWSDGGVTQLYPNGLHVDNRIEASQPLVVPQPGEFVLRVRPPFGRDRIEAIVTEQPWKAESLQRGSVESTLKSLDGEGAKAVEAETSSPRDAGFCGRGEVVFETRGK